MGPARLQKNEHTFVHYYDLQPLYDEYSKLNIQYNELRLSYSNNSIFSRELDNYNKIVKYSQTLVLNKINNIKIHNRTRIAKRGLLNGVGSIIKSLTGNLDASDGEKIYGILNHVQNNENNLQNQLKFQYSLNHQLISNFNKTIQDIQHNEVMLKSKIIQLSRFIENGATHQDVLFAKDLFNQLSILYNAILNTLQDVENSITFCKLNTLHPSIIKSHDLFLEIQRISSHYGITLPFEVNYENILDFESILKIHCKIDSDKITYFLSIPIYSEIEFDLFYMLPIPTKHKSEYLTIIPNAKFILKAKNSNLFKPLSDKCTQGKWYHCPNKLQVNYRAPCEEDILLYRNSSRCHLTQLEINENHIETVPEINQYLAVFPKEENIEAQCEKSIETRTLMGVFLIKRDSCKLHFRGQKLIFQETSYGKPLVVNSINFKTRNHYNPTFKIELRKLNLKELPINPIIPIEDKSINNYHIPSLWTVILYILLATSISYLYIRRKKNKRSNKKKKTTNESEEIEMGNKKISLPGDASF